MLNKRHKGTKYALVDTTNNLYILICMFSVIFIKVTMYIYHCLTLDITIINVSCCDCPARCFEICVCGNFCFLNLVKLIN